MTAPTSSPPQQGGELSEFIGRELVQYVAELSDRTSPEDQPLMMLATAEELEAGIRLAFERWQESDQSRRSTPDTGEREEHARRLRELKLTQVLNGTAHDWLEEAAVYLSSPRGEPNLTHCMAVPSTSPPLRRTGGE